MRHKNWRVQEIGVSTIQNVMSFAFAPINVQSDDWPESYKKIRNTELLKEMVTELVLVELVIQVQEDVQTMASKSNKVGGIRSA